MLERKILLVTGASSEVACKLIREIQENYGVILAHYCNSEEPISELCKEFGKKIVPVKADFSDLKDVRRMVWDIKKTGYEPDHIVHLSAKKIENAKFHKIETEEYMDSMNIAFFSFIELVKEFIVPMIKRRYGKILIMLSSGTLDMPPKYQAKYVTTKYALLGLMKSLSVEYAGKGITVNAISPQMIETKFLSEMPELIVKQSALNSPLKRNLKVDDIIPLFKYLLSDGSDMVTGQNFGITGGIRF